MANDTLNRPACKIVLLGNSGVGKTSIVTRWTSGQWQSSIKPTVGANHQRKKVEIDDQEVDLFLWDTAGQEQFQALTPLYARSAAAAIIVTAINDISSFDSIDTWIDLVNNSCDSLPPIILAINKIDITENIVLTHDEIEDKYHSRFDGIFYVSAITGEELDNLFMQAAVKGFHYSQSGVTGQAKATSLTATKTSSGGCC